jgi:SAM-dependent methyltransferase
MNITTPADNLDEIRKKHAANRNAWNEAAEKYSQGLDKAIAFIKAGKSSLHPIERANLGNLNEWCDTAIHLQCASGRDTLSLINEGVIRVIGVDISDVHIENAKRLASATNANATWYRCDVLDTPSELDETADLVYTGRGALCWIHDIGSWSRVVARLLKPGGVFHVFDDHPFTWLIDQHKRDLAFSSLDYFSCSIADKGWAPEYIGDLGKPTEEMATKHERLWPISIVVQALINSGLSIEFLGEHNDEYWNSFPHLNKEQKSKIPMTFSAKARKVACKPLQRTRTSHAAEL